MAVPPRIPVDQEFVLDGPRLDDSAAHRRLATDPEAARFFGWPAEQAAAAPDSHYVAEIEKLIRGWESDWRYSFAIRRVSDGELVGTVELRRRPAESVDASDEFDISYLVAPELRGRGLAPRALETALGWAASQRGARLATIQCDPDNVASQRVALKCGFAHAGAFAGELRFQRMLAEGPAEATD
jgi:RimJ/RimL family protein N-acetyltransferase